MAETERPDQEPVPPKEPAAAPAEKGRGSFAKLRRELSDEELSSPAIQRRVAGSGLFFIVPEQSS